MKKILLATAIFAFAYANSNAQNPAPAPTKKVTPTGVQTTKPEVTTPKPANQSTVAPATKPAPKVAPATVRKGKPVMHQKGTHGKKTPHKVKENKDAAKPMAPGTNDKK